MPAYATDHDVVARFATEKARDAWVEAGELLGRQPIDADAERVERIQTLVEQGVARWREVHDPDLQITYEAPDRVIPVSVIREHPELGTSEAIAYWLCDDPDGPGLTQQAAADAIGKARGTVKTQLGEAREKLDES